MSISPEAIAAAEQLVADLKGHSGSVRDQASVVRQLERLRCLVQTGPDALMFQSYPVRTDEEKDELSTAIRKSFVLMRTVSNFAGHEYFAGLWRL